MKASIKATVQLGISGNTGHANNSTMTLTLLDIGSLKLPHDEWDLSALEGELHKLTGLRLDIPSGSLTLDGHVLVSIDDREITISGAGEWDGKAAGFLGGMSGYASFTGAFLAIKDGTYKVSSDPYYLEPDRYFERIARHQAGENYHIALDDAKFAASVHRIPRRDRTTEEEQFLREWDAGILAREKLTPEEFIAAVNERTLEVAAATSDHLLPEAVGQKLKALATLPDRPDGSPENFLPDGDHDRWFAQLVNFQIAWKPEDASSATVEKRWAICCPVGEAFYQWWASAEETAILEAYAAEKKANSDDDEGHFDYGDEEA